MIAQLLTYVALRAVLERCLTGSKDRSTPGRITSLAHGLVCTYMLAASDYSATILLTGGYFVVDLALNCFYCRAELDLANVLHHVLGSVLCFSSFVWGTHHEDHIGSAITRALIALETTNPLLQTSIILKKEEIGKRLLPFLGALTLIHWSYVRIAVLGHALLSSTVLYCHHMLASVPYTILLASSFAMWMIQIFWWIRLLRATVKSISIG